MSCHRGFLTPTKLTLKACHPRIIVVSFPGKCSPRDKNSAAFARHPKCSKTLQRNDSSTLRVASENFSKKFTCKSFFRHFFVTFLYLPVVFEFVLNNIHLKVATLTKKLTFILPWEVFGSYKPTV